MNQDHGWGQMSRSHSSFHDNLSIHLGNIAFWNIDLENAWLKLGLGVKRHIEDPTSYEFISLCSIAIHLFLRYGLTSRGGQNMVYKKQNKFKFKISLLSNKIQHTIHNTMCTITCHWLDYISLAWLHIAGLAINHGISNTFVSKIPQFTAKPAIWTW